MLIHTVKRDYFMPIIIGVSGIILSQILPLIFHDVTLENVSQVTFDVSVIVSLSMAACSAIVFVDVLLEILKLDVEQVKLKQKNLIPYGIRATSIFSMVFAELALFLYEITIFFAHISNSYQGLSQEQVLFYHIAVLICGVFLTWNSKKFKIPYKQCV